MKVISLIFAITCICYLAKTHAQPCLPDGITFSSQEQVDSFKADYPDCTEIEGGVLVEGNDITNLDSLHVLTTIGNYL